MLLILLRHLILIIEKNTLLILVEGSTVDINDSTGVAERKFIVNFSEGNTKFWLSFHYSGDNSYLFVYKTNISKLKANDNIRWNEFCLGSILKDITKDGQIEIFLNSIADDLLVHESYT